jgi:hypothetical protein
MEKFTTESGATYVVDRDTKRIVRLEGPDIDFVRHHDGYWHAYESLMGLHPQSPVVIRWPDGRVRHTSPVVSVEEVQ